MTSDRSFVLAIRFFEKKKRKKNERSIPINRGWKYLSIKIALDVTSMIDIEVEGL